MLHMVEERVSLAADAGSLPGVREPDDYLGSGMF
jgi:hypothetical protein